MSPFTPKSWENAPSEATPLSATAHIDLETRLSDYTDLVGKGGVLVASATDTDLGTYSSTAARVVPLRRDWVDVDEFAGTDVVRITAAVTLAAAENKIVRFDESRTFTVAAAMDLTSALSVATRPIRLELGAAQIHVTASPATATIYATGTETAKVDLTVSVAQWAESVTLPSGDGAGWVRGDWIAVESLTPVYSTYGYGREIKQVLAVTGDVLTVDSPFLYPHAQGGTDKARYSKITPLRAPRIVGGEWTWADAIAYPGYAVQLVRCSDVDIDGLRIVDGGGGIVLTECLGGHVRAEFDRLPNYSDSYGYGVTATGRCQNLTCDITSRGCRHAFTTLSQERSAAVQGNVGGVPDPLSPNGSYFVGGPSQIKVKGSANHDAQSPAAWDTHEFGELIDFDVSVVGSITGLQVRARSVTGSVRAKGCNLSGVELVETSRDCNLKVDIVGCGGLAGDRGMGINGTNNRVSGRVADCFGPGVMFGADAPTNPSVDTCISDMEIRNNATCGVQDGGALRPRIMRCEIPQSATQTTSVVNLGSTGRVYDSELLGYGGSSIGFSGVNVAARVKGVMGDAGVFGNQTINVGNPANAPSADANLFRGAAQLVRTTGVLMADKGFRTSLTINTAGQTSAQIDALWLTATGSAAADGAMINDQTNFLTLFRAGGKWYKSAALALIA